MNYNCRYCNYNLDGGDILTVLKNKYPHLSQIDVMKKAMLYGYTPENQLHFINILIVQPDNKTQYETCINCNNINPLQ